MLVTNAPGLGFVAVKVRMKLVACLLACVSSSMSLADPLHRVDNGSTWRHEFSGWQFPQQVGEFERVTVPYTIDGNNDVGVQYRRIAGESRTAAVVEVYLTDSAASVVKLDGAKAQAARQAGEVARQQSERPFRVGEHERLRGTKVTYGKSGSRAPQTVLYFFATDRCIVKVVGSTDASRETTVQALDAFVQALPWGTLGDPAALHLQ